VDLIVDLGGARDGRRARSGLVERRNAERVCAWFEVVDVVATDPPRFRSHGVQVQPVVVVIFPHLDGVCLHRNTHAPDGPVPFHVDRVLLRVSKQAYVGWTCRRSYNDSERVSGHWAVSPLQPKVELQTVQLRMNLSGYVGHATSRLHLVECSLLHPV